MTPPNFKRKAPDDHPIDDRHHEETSENSSKKRRIHPEILQQRKEKLHAIKKSDEFRFYCRNKAQCGADFSIPDPYSNDSDAHQWEDLVGEWWKALVEFRRVNTDVFKYMPGEKETDERRLEQRQKQIDFGKNTIGYDNYIKRFPKKGRKPQHLRTPDKYKRQSKRAWDGLVRKWRQYLHQYDNKDQDDGVEGRTAIITEDNEEGQDDHVSRAVNLEDKSVEDRATAAATILPSIYDSFFPEEEEEEHQEDDEDELL